MIPSEKRYAIRRTDILIICIHEIDNNDGYGLKCSKFFFWEHWKLWQTYRNKKLGSFINVLLKNMLLLKNIFNFLKLKNLFRKLQIQLLYVIYHNFTNILNYIFFYFFIVKDDIKRIKRKPFIAYPKRCLKCKLDCTFADCNEFNNFVCLPVGRLKSIHYFHFYF